MIDGILQVGGVLQMQVLAGLILLQTIDIYIFMHIAIHVILNGGMDIHFYVINIMPLIFQIIQAIQPIMNINNFLNIIVVKTVMN